MRELTDHTSVVGGGGAGIGAATAIRLAHEGARIVVGDVNSAGTKKTAGTINDAGGTAIGVEFDLADDASVNALIDRAVSEWGTVHGLFNCGADVSPQNTGRDTPNLGGAGIRGGVGVSAYAAPARAGDLAGLPPAYVLVCEFDPVRDEGLQYAQRLIQAGVATELHLFPGTFHGSIGIPDARVSRRIRAEQVDALGRGLRAGIQQAEAAGHTTT
ncbi:MAG: lipase/esterase [Streptomyces oryziradicis]|nr:lipase/esterase [Actinacidiphila oryziradicis]